MSKTILADIDGWTPLIDNLTRDHGLVTSAVFGRIWRFCQGKKGTCYASLETIAKDLGINKATVMRHAKQLVEAGYLKDETPDARNTPHIYADTGKAGISIRVGVAENNATVAQCNTFDATVAQCNATVAESQLKKEVRNNMNIIENKRNNISPPKNGGERGSSAEEEHKYKTELALVKGIAKSIAGGRDLANWPEDVNAIVQVVCELWHLHPPTSGKSKAYWIASARELNDAASEYGVAAIRAVRDDFEAHMRSHSGLPPFGVEGPNSLVKATRAKAGQLRGQGQERDRDRYVSGEYAEFIEH